MGFNYGKKRSEKEKEFEKIATICRDNGMTEINIENIHRLLLNELNSDRRYYTHTQSYSVQFSGKEVAEESYSSLHKRFFDQFSTAQYGISEWERHSWVEDIDSPEIVSWLKTLPEHDIELLTLIMEGMSQTEIAAMCGYSIPSISKRKKRIRDDLKKHLSED